LAGRKNIYAKLPVQTSNPKVSACIIHHNRPALLKQAIASIDLQDYANVELVIVDDGSDSADALALLDEIERNPTFFTSKELKLIRSTNNYLGAARNLAAREATGEYLVFLDDDNFAKPNQISTYVSVTKTTGAVEVTAGHDVFFGNGVPTPESTSYMWVPLGPSLSVGLFRNCFGDANFFVQKKAFLDIGGFTEEKGVGQEDHEFHAKMALKGYKQEFIPESLLYYRMHGANQMIQETDPVANQIRSIRPYAEAISFESVATVIASRNTFIARSHLPQYVCNFTITSISPTSIDVTAGGLITIKGSELDCFDVDDIYLTTPSSATVDCTGLSITATQITCTLPGGSLEIGGQQVLTISAASGADTFTYAIDVVDLSKPSVLSCSFTSTGSGLLLSWNKATNTPAGCTAFTSATIATFGTSPSCVWTDTQTLTVTFGTNPTIGYPGGSVTVAAGIVSPLGGGAGDVQFTYSVFPPVPLPEPTATLVAPSSVGNCEPIPVKVGSVSGGAARAFTSWIWSNVENDAGVQAFLQTLPNNTQSFTVPNNLLTQGNTYTFSLYLQNWMGGESTTYTTGTTISQYAIPTVTVSNSPSVYINSDVVVSVR
jgi:glycosyltransferase involved in cell wall biosynthesis